MALTDHIAAMPKAELHVHMEGSLAPETLLTIAEANRLRLPFDTIEGARDFYVFRDFAHFAQAFLLGVKCLRREEDFAFAVERLGAALAAQNVRYAEVTFTPQFYLGRPFPLDAVLAAMNAGRAKARVESGVEMRWIPDLVRSYPEPMHQIAEWVTRDAAIEGGVVALGLGGPEAGHPAANFEAPFRRAREAGLPANPHAGETDGPASIRAALDVLKAARIGHGVRAADDPALMRELTARRVALEVCPTSNLRLNLYSSYAVHPLKTLAEAGCVVTVNTDDPPLFGTSLNEEYRHAVEDCGLTLDQLEDAALNAVTFSYLPERDKAAMRTAFASDYARLRAAHGLPARTPGAA